MTYATVLILLCLLSVTLTGFGAAIALFRESRIDPGQRVRISNLLVLSLASAFFCVLPLIILASRVPELMAFRVSQITLAALVSLIVAARFIPSYRLNRSRITDLTLFFSSIAMLLGTAILQVVSALDDRSAMASYMTGVTMVIIVAGIAFFRVVSATMNGNEP
jgi:predicted Co/Zn/Cd cation transporter (cation efflux family)